MITYFSMEGFLSVKKKVELYFVPKPHTRITNTRFEDNFIHTPKYKLMKAAVLFGMNASGKSNVLLRMDLRSGSSFVLYVLLSSCRI